MFTHFTPADLVAILNGLQIPATLAPLNGCGKLPTRSLTLATTMGNAGAILRRSAGRTNVGMKHFR